MISYEPPSLPELAPLLVTRPPPVYRSPNGFGKALEDDRCDKKPPRNTHGFTSTRRVKFSWSSVDRGGQARLTWGRENMYRCTGWTVTSTKLLFRATVRRKAFVRRTDDVTCRKFFHSSYLNAAPRYSRPAALRWFIAPPLMELTDTSGGTSSTGSPLYPPSAPNDNPSEQCIVGHWGDRALTVNPSGLHWVTALNLKSCSRGQLIYWPSSFLQSMLCNTDGICQNQVHRGAERRVKSCGPLVIDNLRIWLMDKVTL